MKYVIKVNKWGYHFEFQSKRKIHNVVQRKEFAKRYDTYDEAEIELNELKRIGVVTGSAEIEEVEE